MTKISVRRSYGNWWQELRAWWATVLFGWACTVHRQAAMDMSVAIARMVEGNQTAHRNRAQNYVGCDS